jgi:transcription elongation GreA/GreB family factor
MIKSRKEELLRLIKVEVGKAKLMRDMTGFDVRNFGTISWRKSDKYQAEDAAELTNKYFENLTKLLDEVKSASDSACETVTPVSFVEISYKSGEKVKLYLVESSTLLPGVLLITPKSPIGRAIVGKKQGDNFSYEIVKEDSKITYSGKIEKIE